MNPLMDPLLANSMASLMPSADPPVLFLDLDDVLCLGRPNGGFHAIEAASGRHPNAGDVHRRLFDARAVKTLEQVHQAVDGDLHYVVSSTWRKALGREQMAELMRRSGLGFVAARLHQPDRWCTPPDFWRSRRVDEIAQWLDCHHRGEAFAVVDDLHSGASLLPALNVADHPFKGRVVLCEEGTGLQPQHVKPIVLALGRPARVRAR